MNVWVTIQNKIIEYEGTSTPLSGKNKFTLKHINSMQILFDIIIRQNSVDLYQVINAIGPILCGISQLIDKDDDYHHCFCLPAQFPCMQISKKIN